MCCQVLDVSRPRLFSGSNGTDTTTSASHGQPTRGRTFFRGTKPGGMGAAPSSCCSELCTRLWVKPWQHNCDPFRPPRDFVLCKLTCYAVWPVQDLSRCSPRLCSECPFPGFEKPRNLLRMHASRGSRKPHEVCNSRKHART